MRINIRRVAVPMALVAVACGGEKVPPLPDPIDVSTTANVPTSSDTVKPGAASTADSATASAAKPSDRVGEFRAAGNEPFWSLVVNSLAMTIKTPQDLTGVAFAPSLPMVSGVRYHWTAATAQPNRHTIDVTIEATTCQDTMADKKWTHTATVIYDGKTLTGCAEGGMPPGTSSNSDAPQKGTNKPVKY